MVIISSPPACLVSSCLMGFCSRYDARLKPDINCVNFLRNTDWIPICPEQAGGLATPRSPAVITGGNGFDVLAGRARVVTVDEQDVTDNFIRGAEQALQLARAKSITTAILKSGSPSCGVHGVIGVTAAMLSCHGFELHES